MKINLIRLILAALIAVGAAGCTVAPAPPTATSISQTITSQPTATPPLPTTTPLLPTETPLPPTDTPLPPSATPTLTDTLTPEPTATLDPTAFELRSPAFGMEEKIPMKHTCDDLDISPPLEWGDPPEGTVSLAIALDDVSANGLGHWVLFNIPPETRSLPEGLPKKERLADGSQQTIGALTQVGYMGPCPAGSNRYRFRLLALDTMLDLDDSVMYVRVMQAIRGHVLAEAELYGVYH